MNSLILFFDMSGHGFFVWSSYLVWIFLLLVLVSKVILRKKLSKKLSNLNLERK